MIAASEMRRRPGRFAAITATLGLLAFLVMVLTGLSDGLFYGSTGAVNNSNATAYAFATPAQESLIRSQLPAQTVDRYRADSGVAAASGIDVILTPAQTAGGTIVDVAVFGVGDGAVGYPAALASGEFPSAPNEVVADTRLADVSIGDQLTVGKQSLDVVGLVADASYQLQPTIWMSLADAQRIRGEVRPELAGSTFVNVVALQLAPGVQLAQVQAVSGTSLATPDEVALAIPGVAQQRSTLSAIIVTTILVSAVVTILFFVLAVLEKRSLFAVLKAVGTPGRRLLGGIAFQAICISALASLVGVILTVVMAEFLPSTIPLALRPLSLIATGLLLVVAACVGSLFAARRISRIDPAMALGVPE